MSEAPRIPVEHRPPDPFGIIILAGVDGEGESAAVDGREFFAEVVSACFAVLEAGEIDADDLEPESSRQCSAAVTASDRWRVMLAR